VLRAGAAGDGVRNLVVLNTSRDIASASVTHTRKNRKNMNSRALTPATVTLLLAFSPQLILAQQVSIGVESFRDDIPSTRTTWNFQAIAQPSQPLYLTLGARQLTVNQDPFHGLPRYEEQLQTGWVEAAMMLGYRAAITGRLGVNRTDDGETDSEYHVRGQFAVPFGSGPGAGATTFSLEAGRARELAVAPAIAEGITYDRIGGGLDFRRGKRITGSARLTMDNYSDDNTKLQGYAYGLLQVANSPTISVGYAFAFADSDVDNWQATQSTYDAATLTWEYRYFYYPYFTPLQEQGHAALATITWSLPRSGSLAATANVPFYSTGLQRVSAQWGTTEQPPDYGYYTASGVMPLQLNASASLPLVSRLTARARYDYFRKSYYSFQGGSASIHFSF
jgi:hypothetical protein